MNRPNIAVVYLARGADDASVASIRRFQESYRCHPAGRDHVLYVLYKGFPTQEALEAARLSFADIPHRPRLYPDHGLDLGSYMLAARDATEEFFFLLNTHSRIAADDWLEKVARYGTRPEIGMASTSASYASAIEINYPGFPNPHLRSNGLFIRRKLYLELTAGTVIREKTDAYHLESGKKSFSRNLAARGLKICLVGRNGRGYDFPSWPLSGCSRDGEQRNLLIHDNQTHAHEEPGPRALWAHRFRETEDIWGIFRSVEFFGPGFRRSIEERMASLTSRPAGPLRKSVKPRLFLASGPPGSRPARLDVPAVSLLRQGLVESLTLIDSTGRLCGGTLPDALDILWVQGAPPPWFANFLQTPQPYLLDAGPASVLAPEFQGADLLVTSCPQARNETATPRVAFVPDAFLHSHLPIATGKPRGLLWKSEDGIPQAILQAVAAFSSRHGLPVHCLGPFPQEAARLLSLGKFHSAMTPEEYDAFLAEAGSLLGIVPGSAGAADTRSDERMVEYGGLGFPAVYGDIPAHRDTDLCTGRVVPADSAAWLTAMEELYAEGYAAEESHADDIREKRSIDRVARDFWLPALEAVRLAEPMRPPLPPG